MPPAIGSPRPAIRSCRVTRRGPHFEAARATYSTRLEAMASYWAAPAAQWLGDPIMLRQPLHATDDP